MLMLKEILKVSILFNIIIFMKLKIKHLLHNAPLQARTVKDQIEMEFRIQSETEEIGGRKHRREATKCVLRICWLKV